MNLRMAQPDYGCATVRFIRSPALPSAGFKEKSHTVNQRKTPGINGLLGKIGQFEFGETGTVLIGNEDTDGYVIVDAVVFVPVKSKR
jgi:hypothetical protein